MDILTTDTCLPASSVFTDLPYPSVTVSISMHILLLTVVHIPVMILSRMRQEFIFKDGDKHHVIWVPAHFSLWSAFCFCLWATFPSASARKECLALTFPSMSSAEIDRLLRHHPKRTIESINRSVHSSAHEINKYSPRFALS